MAMEIGKKFKKYAMMAQQVALIVYILVKGGEGMELMFAWLIQLGQLTIEEVEATFPKYVDKTIERLKYMGLDQNGQLLA